MIDELKTFREKYPDYGDMDDATLAGRLADKYPDAYGDLPTKVKAESMVTPAPSPAPQEPNAILHGAATTASGFNRGVSGMAGMPVDVLNAALSSIGLGSKEPIMGSQFIQSKIMPQEVKPSGIAENILNATAEQVPYFMPGVGLAAKAGPIANTIYQSGKVALGSGVGSGLARTFAPDNPYLDMAAQIVGGLSPSIAKAGISLVPSSAERSMMERAIKPSTVVKEAERTRRIETALDEGITATKGGLEKSKAIIGDINNEIQQRINQFTSQGAKVNTENVMKPAIAMAKEEIPKMAFPEGPTNQIVGALEGFAGNPKYTPELSLREAQNYKQSINKELDDFYKALQTSPDKTAAIASQWTNKTKAKIADGLREEISNIYPEVREQNQREGALIQLNKSLERAVNRISQHDFLSLRGLVALVTHPKYAVMNYIVNNPAVQSNLAVIMRKSRTSGFNVPGVAGEAMKQAADRISGVDFSSQNNQGGEIQYLQEGGW